MVAASQEAASCLINPIILWQLTRGQTKISKHDGCWSVAQLELPVGEMKTLSVPGVLLQSSEVNYRIVNLIIPLLSDSQECKMLDTVVLYLSLKWGRICGLHTDFHFMLLALIHTAFPSWAMAQLLSRLYRLEKERLKQEHKRIKQIPVLCCQMLLTKKSQWQPQWRIIRYSHSVPSYSLHTGLRVLSCRHLLCTGR